MRSGFALLVVLSSASAAMLRMTGVQQAGSTAAILGARANWAARSGIEWALHEAVVSSGCPAPSARYITSTAKFERPSSSERQPVQPNPLREESNRKIPQTSGLRDL
jgi:hypothetical protein